MTSGKISSQLKEIAVRNKIGAKPAAKTSSGGFGSASHRQLMPRWQEKFILVILLIILLGCINPYVLPLGWCLAAEIFIIGCIVCTTIFLIKDVRELVRAVPSENE